MANKPTVTLTLAGDEKTLTASADRAARGVADMGNKVGASSAEMAKRVNTASDDVVKSTKSVETASEGMSSKFGAASKSMIAGAGALGLGVGSALAGIFQQANVGGLLTAQLGGGAERAAQLGAIAGKVYADNFGESMTEVGAALKGVIGSNLVDEDATDADIQHVTEKLLTVSQVVGDETGNVSRAVQQMLRTGLADSATQAFDLIVRAQQQGLNKSGDLLDSLNEYGTQLRKLGLDGPTALGLVSQAIRGGARDSDIAVDALKEFSIRAIDGTKASQNAFHDLGLDGAKMAAQIAQGGTAATAGLDTVLKKVQALKDPLARNSVATGLFGTQWEDLGAALLSFDVGKAPGELGKLAGAADEASAAIGDTPEAKFESFKRGMEQDLIDVVNRAAPLLQSFGTFVTQNMDVLLPMAAVIGGIALAQWAWNAAMEANPLVLIATLVGGLVIGLIALWEKSAAFRDFFIGTWNGIKDVVGAVVDWVIGAWNRVADFFIQLPMTVGNAFSNLGTIMVDGAKSALNGLVNGMNWFLDHSLNWLIDRVNDVSGAVGIPPIPPIPHIPTLHAGGVFHAPGADGQGLALLRDGERVSTPGQGGGSGTLRVIGSGALVELLQAMIFDGSLQLVGR